MAYVIKATVGYVVEINNEAVERVASVEAGIDCALAAGVSLDCIAVMIEG